MPVCVLASLCFVGTKATRVLAIIVGSDLCEWLVSSLTVLDSVCFSFYFGARWQVTRDQQTWRKEFKGEKKATVPVVETHKEEKSSKKKLTGLPICEYQERGHKWVVEHQASAQLVVEVTDPKQQVYMFNCNHVTLQVKGGKLKSVILDSCQHCQVVFETVISACEVVHCKKIELQTTGVCPSFSIDQTEGCLVYLSKESVATTSFVTSQSTEMNGKSMICVCVYAIQSCIVQRLRDHIHSHSELSRRRRTKGASNPGTICPQARPWRGHE